MPQRNEVLGKRLIRRKEVKNGLGIVGGDVLGFCIVETGNISLQGIGFRRGRGLDERWKSSCRVG